MNYKELKDYIKSDALITNGYTSNSIRNAINNYSFQIVFLFRVINYIKQKRVFLPITCLLKILFSTLCHIHGITLPICAKIGRGLYMPHYGCVVINNKAQIGTDAIIMQCVTIGSNWCGNHAGVPTIGDRIIICSNSVIVGNVRIGNNVFIGAGTIVTKDIPDNSLVMGNPMRIIPNKGLEYNKVYRREK